VRVQLVLSIKMITCPRCNRSSANLRSLLVHLAKVHSNEPHFRIVCKLPKPIGSCCSVFSSLASYKIHINRFHSRLLMSDKWENSSIRTEILCSVCNAAVHSLQGLSSHYKEHCTDGVSVPCVVRHCPKTFSVYSSYTSHMSRSHKNVSLCHIRDELKRQETVDYQLYDSESALDITSNVELEEISDMPSMTKNIALLFMKLKAQYCLADSTVQAIVSDFSDVCDVSSSMIRQRIRHLCSSYNLPPKAFAEFNDAADCFSWNSAMTELSSDWKRNSYYTSVPAVLMSQSDASASGDCLTVSVPAVSLPLSVRRESDETVIVKPPVKKKREAKKQCTVWHDNDSISEMKLEWLKSEGVRDNSKLLSLLRKNI